MRGHEVIIDMGPAQNEREALYAQTIEHLRQKIADLELQLQAAEIGGVMERIASAQ
jgi:hypothetical protein